MTEKGDDDTERELPYRPEWGLPIGSSRDDPVGADESTDSKSDREGFGQEQWEQLPSDPDLIEDLGYAHSEWEEFATLDESETVIFLPADEDVLQQDAFVVAGKDSIADLGQQY